MNNLKLLIDQAKDHRPENLGNGWLYKLCERYPGHKTDEEIIAKIWLIGRSYAAPVERGRKRKIKTTDERIITVSSDDFYIQYVAPMMQKVDPLFRNLRHRPVELHEELVLLFQSIRGIEHLRKISLASKYLHFHFPKVFYIYDSRARLGLKELMKRLKIVNHRKNGLAYSKFFNGCKMVIEEIKSKYGSDLTPRQLDNLLLKIYAEKEKQED